MDDAATYSLDLPLGVVTITDVAYPQSANLEQPPNVIPQWLFKMFQIQANCDDAAALAHACKIVRELMLGLTHADRSSLVKVRDETRPMVFSIPFFAACA